MSDQAPDALWEIVERVIRDWAGASTRLDRLCPLAGGLVSTTLLVHPHNNRPAVVKLSSHRVNQDHAREAAGLRRLAEIGLPVPRVLAHRTASLDFPHSYLIVEHVDAESLRDLHPSRLTADERDRLQEELAELVAALHGQDGADYGRLEGERHSRWPAFYRSLVEPVWAAVKDHGSLPIRTRKTIGRLHERLDALLDHDDRPRLCHGDLWAGNVLCGVDKTGRWRIAALIDPDLRYGHAESEIAYMDCFRTITRAFKNAYASRFRLADGYHARRKPIYQLYALINQLQLREMAPVASVIAAAERVAMMV